MQDDKATGGDPVDFEALREEFARNEARNASISKLLDAADELGLLPAEPSVDPWPKPAKAAAANVLPQSPNKAAYEVRIEPKVGNSRHRRTVAETDAIKQAIYEAIKTMPRSNADTFLYLASEGIVSDNRKDRDLVRNTLKRAVDDGLMEVSSDIYSWRKPSPPVIESLGLNGEEVAGDATQGEITDRV